MNKEAYLHCLVWVFITMLHSATTCGKAGGLGHRKRASCTCSEAFEISGPWMPIVFFLLVVLRPLNLRTVYLALAQLVVLTLTRKVKVSKVSPPVAVASATRWVVLSKLLEREGSTAQFFPRIGQICVFVSQNAHFAVPPTWDAPSPSVLFACKI